MTIGLLKENVERENNITKELFSIYNKYAELYNQDNVMDKEKNMKLMEQSMISLMQQLRMLNNALPDLVEGVSFYKKLYSSQLDNRSKPKGIVNVKYIDETTKEKASVAIKKKDEMSFLKSLTSHKFSLKKLISKKTPNEKIDSSKKASENKTLKAYVSASNRFFRDSSNKLIDKGYFRDLKIDLRKITSPLLITTYVSIMLFSVFLSIFLGIFISILVVILGLGIMAVIAVFFLVPVIVFLMVYFYPSSQRKNLEKEINQELPFLVIYMAAISTSGLEPSKLFNILVVSEEYPFTRRELKKLTNYVNFYGYDLVTALKVSSKNCPSERLAQLFDGFATAITSGGSLTEFLNKHSESLLFDYRIEREKYTHLAETFMNIYISIVIAAPLLLMMLFILMRLTGFGGSTNMSGLGVMAVLVIGILNLGFLTFLNAKQPKF
ncbi:MAG: type II secretion system F family protein [archaeon]|nr:type II secretion system F family protein [archaeon]